MNQKGMQEQNDISIIGKLPKRLQQKIAENCYGKMSATGNSSKDHFKLTEVEEEEEEADEMTTLVPGILRLNMAETARQTTDVVGLSPARQLPKSAISLPSWCELASAPAIVQELPTLHAHLIDYIKRDALLKQWRQFKEVSEELQQLFANLLLQHLKFCCEQKVDTFFWKLLFYNVREQLKQQRPLKQVQQYLLELLEDGLQFYQKLYEQLEAKYLLHAAAGGRKTNCQKYEFIAKVMAQKLLISLGDLSRYRAKQIQCVDLKEATAYYLRAQQLIPSNGIPYNQLAIVAIQSRKKFDAVYFHMRSLMSSNSIGSARESLLVLFDEIRKKYEEIESKKSPLQRSYQKGNRTRHDCSKSALRKEIWVHPETTCANLHRNDFRCNQGTDYFKLLQQQQIKYDAIHDDELSRHFINLYLYVIGKLYSGISMDNLLDHQKKLCAKLNSLLQRQSFVETFGRKRLLKILTLNIFIVEVNKNQETRRYQAFLFANQIFGLILQQCNKLLTSKSFAEDNELFEQNFCHLSALLQYIHLYTKWLIKNVDIWAPLRQYDYDYNCWQELHTLFENISHLVVLKNGQIEAFTRVAFSLEEEIFAAGFTPLCEQKERAALSATEQEPKTACKLAAFYMRLVRISNFKSVVEANQARLQLEKLPHEHEIDEFRFILQTSNKLKNAQQVFKKSKSAQELSIGSRAEEKISTKDDNCTGPGNDAHLEVMQLSKLKRELEAKTSVKRLYKAKLEEIMNDVDTKLYIEVRPKYLLPDTNCFIDSIDDIEKLVEQFKCYTLMIPLTVVKELDGLAKGIKVESYQTALPKDRIHHYDDVSTRAKRSLEFIKNAKNQVKCASTKGSIINASLFALVEEEYVSNDDKILATAVALSKNFSVETSAGGRCFIQTELVLITTDRNLRVKALSRKLAVSDLSDFLAWTNDKVK